MARIKIFAAILVILLYSCNGNTFFSTIKKNPVSDTSFHFRKMSESEAAYYKQALEYFYDTMLLTKGFNGSIIVAKNNEILLEDYRGTYNFSTGEPVSENSSFHLASISKTFTAMTTLKLMEQGRLQLDDSLQKYFPALPYHGITIKMLLNHRSGLPNYLYFMDSLWDKKKKAANNDVLNYMIQHHPAADAMPDKGYQYRNTNFVLLALIIEQVTRQPFPCYMKDSIFTPLGLTNSFVFSTADTLRYNPTYSVTKPYMMDHLDCTYGDKNIYCSARDLLQWDKALYEEKFLKKSTLDLAFAPYSNEKPTMHNYGLGWHLFFNNGDSIIYHNGKWHGTNTVFTRLIQDTATIIVLGNKFNSNIYSAMQMASIFNTRHGEIKQED